MRALLTIVSLIAITGCAPTLRETLAMDTAEYTHCDHVEIDCVDEDCSNLRGGPWLSTACGTRYRCDRVNETVTCVPLDS